MCMNGTVLCTNTQRDSVTLRYHFGNFVFGSVTVLAIQLFNKIKKKKTNLKKHVSLYFPDVMSKFIYF